MTAEAVNNAASYLALSGAIPSALAFVTFVLGRPRTWWKSWLGWVMALLFFSIVLVFAVVLGRRFFGEYPGYEWVAVAAYSLLTVTLWMVWAIIVRERHRGRALGMVPFPDAPPKRSR